MDTRMYKVKDVVSVIEAFAPLGIQESWDNSGLSVGSPESPVHSILLGLDCTPELVDEAVAAGADMIVTHHPLIFSGLKKIAPEDPVGLAVMKAVKAGVSVYSAHTTADKVVAGVSGAMARRLGLSDIMILDREDGDVGLGTVGNLPFPMSSADAVRYVKADRHSCEQGGHVRRGRKFPHRQGGGLRRPAVYQRRHILSPFFHGKGFHDHGHRTL